MYTSGGGGGGGQGGSTKHSASPSLPPVRLYIRLPKFLLTEHVHLHVVPLWITSAAVIRASGCGGSRNYGAVLLVTDRLLSKLPEGVAHGTVEHHCGCVGNGASLVRGDRRI